MSIFLPANAKYFQAPHDLQILLVISGVSPIFHTGGRSVQCVTDDAHKPKVPYLYLLTPHAFWAAHSIMVTMAAKHVNNVRREKRRSVHLSKIWREKMLHGIRDKKKEKTVQKEDGAIISKRDSSAWNISRQARTSQRRLDFKHNLVCLLKKWPGLSASWTSKNNTSQW